MKLTRNDVGHYWRTDDEASLPLSEAGPYAPTQVEAHVIGQRHLVQPDERPITLDNLGLIGVARFGEGRGRDGHKYTGDYLKFAIYQNNADFGRPNIVILRTDGSGSHWYVTDDLHAVNMWVHLARTLSTESLWDVCATLIGTYRAGRDAERNKQHSLFLQGRLKKRKRGGKYYVEVLPAEEAKAS